MYVNTLKYLKFPKLTFLNQGSESVFELLLLRSSSSCLSFTLWILPLTVFGKLATNSIFLGYLYGAVTRLQWSWSSFWRDLTSVSDFNLFFVLSDNKTNAFTTIPRRLSGLATTADSNTAGWDINADSTSNGPIRYLENS